MGVGARSSDLENLRDYTRFDEQNEPSTSLVCWLCGQASTSVICPLTVSSPHVLG